MAYNTGNPIGSVDARDLYDNAQNMDKAVNQTTARWSDRFGVSRPSWSGMSHYINVGEYAADILITGYNEVFRYDGEFYRAAADTTLPYTTTGSWSEDGPLFVPVGDAVLRHDMAYEADLYIGYYRNAINCNQYGGLEAAVANSDTLGKTIVVTDTQDVTIPLDFVGRDLAVDGGVITFSGTGAITGLKEARPEWFGPNTVPGTTNMTTPLQKAITAANTIVFSAATYLVDTVTLDANTNLIGAGIGSTIIKQGTTTGATYGSFYAESGSSSIYISDIHISDMTIDGDVATKGFSEFEHLISLNGVKDVVIERVKFLGFRGDGLYIGSGHAGDIEMHNKNVTVRDSIFDGVNWDNRNGVSIIDGSNIVITKNHFTNCSKITMPGAIDIEPNAATYHVIYGIKILDNDFYNNKGSAGSIGAYFPDVAYTSMPTDIIISGNTIDAGAGSDPGIQLVHAGNATAARKHNVLITNNRIKYSGRGFRLFGMNGVELSQNSISSTYYNPLIGYPNTTSKCMNIAISNNIFWEIGTNTGGGLSVYTVDYLKLTKNTFIDSGKTDGTLGYAIDFGTGTSSYVSMIGNIFENPNTKTTFAVKKEATHTFTTATNKAYNNDFVDCVGNAFEADEDDAVKSFTPVISGATSAGTGTYTTQVGRYARHGKIVTFTIGLIWTAHDGTGQIKINLPFTVSASSPLFTAATIVGDDMALIAGDQLVAVLRKETAAIEIITSNTGDTTATAVEAAGTLWISGSYFVD